MEDMKKIDERKGFIIESLNAGTSTMSKLAKMFGVSRQRISEIYHKTIGQKQGYYKKQKEVIAKQKLEKHLTEIKFYCAACHIPVTYRDAGNRSKYCAECHRQNRVLGRDLNIDLACAECGKRFHPYRSKRTLHNFCSKKCFHQSRIKDKFAYAQKMGAKRG